MYNLTNDYIIRTPLKPFKTQFDIVELEKIYELKDVQEALYIASPVLFKEYHKSIINGTFNKEKKLILSLLNML